MMLGSNYEPAPELQSGTPLRFTPAEWRLLLEDPAFLKDLDNSYLKPRRLMGAKVEIVPDHRFG